jgi:hypothetical protein
MENRMTSIPIDNRQTDVGLSRRSPVFWVVVALVAMTSLGLYAVAGIPNPPAERTPSIEPAQPELLSDPAPLDDSLPSEGTGVPDAKTVFAGREMPLEEPAPTF